MKHLPLIAIVAVALFLPMCKAKNSSATTPDNQPDIPVDLAYSDTGEKLNPDQAILQVSLTEIKTSPEEILMLGKMVKMDKQSAGFTAYINAGDEITILSSDSDASWELKRTYRIIVEDIKQVAENNSAKVRLVKVLE